METYQHFDGLMQERSNSIANALELHHSCTTHRFIIITEQLVQAVGYLLKEHKDLFILIRYDGCR